MSDRAGHGSCRAGSSAFAARPVTATNLSQCVNRHSILTPLRGTAQVVPVGVEVRARRRDGEILDRAQVRVNAEAFARLDAGGGLAPLFAGVLGLTPDERHLVETEEAWILGFGHEEALKGVLPPP